MEQRTISAYLFRTITLKAAPHTVGKVSGFKLFAVLEKFGGDSISETKRNMESFLESIPAVLKSFEG
jgi:hypothetical protein